MTGRPLDRPLAWNVAGVLTEEPGAERGVNVANLLIDLGDDLRLAEPINGLVRLVRTNRGILARADLHAALALVCSRCLGDVVFGVDLRFHEEYLPSVDLASGRPLSPADEPDVARLSDHHELDLETSVREALQLAEPIAPLCRPGCPGLCIACGERPDEGVHDHPLDTIDQRLEALSRFRPDDA